MSENKKSQYMKGLLYAESEQQRLTCNGLNPLEVSVHLWNLHLEETYAPENERCWVEGIYDYREHFRENHEYILKQ